MSQRQRGRRSHPGAATLTAMLLCLAASACTSTADPEPAPSPARTTATSTTPEPVTLRFAVYGEPEVLAAYRRLAAAYTVGHPQVTVEVEAVADAVTARDRLDRALDQGTPPDLFLVPQMMLPSLVEQERVQPVDELLERRGVEFGDKYQRLGLEAFAADAALQCMPNDVSPYVVYYNKRMLEPATLGEPGSPRRARRPAGPGNSSPRPRSRCRAMG